MIEGEVETCDLQVDEYNNFILADSFTVVKNCGNNGSGKSFLAMALAKYCNPNFNWENNILYAYHRNSDFIQKIEEAKNDVLWCDEITRFLNYKEHADKKNSKLIQFIEIARANRVAFISCARAYRKVDKQYREGKSQIVINMIDWFAEEMPLGKSYGAVFCAPPVVESANRFGLDVLSEATNVNELRYLCESRPSFIGYIFLEDIVKSGFVTKEELDVYRKRKQEGISDSMEQFKEIILNKEAKEEGRSGIKDLSKESLEKRKEKVMKEIDDIDNLIERKKGISNFI